MTLLLDENLSHKLVSVLSDAFPGIRHVRDLGLKRSPDTDIWVYAKERGFVIVSKDADFHQRSILYGFPPKVIGIFSGNCPTTMIQELIGNNKDRIDRFIQNVDASFLPLIP